MFSIWTKPNIDSIDNFCIDVLLGENTIGSFAPASNFDRSMAFRNTDDKSGHRNSAAAVLCPYGLHASKITTYAMYTHDRTIVPLSVILPCCVECFKRTWQLTQIPRANKIAWDLSLRWVSGGYPILWQHMMTSSNGNIFSVTGHLCGEYTGGGEGRWREVLMFSLVCK